MMPSPQAKEAPTKFTGKYKDVKHFLKCYNNLCATYNVEEDTEKCEHILEFSFFFQQFITRCSIAVRGKPYKQKYSLQVYTCKIGRETAALMSPFRAVMSPARAKHGQENDKEHWVLRCLPKPALAPDTDHP
jgi:hypothetical protein